MKLKNGLLIERFHSAELLLAAQDNNSRSL
jgi:hypothetical protein